jgi:UrcA family protein
MDNRTHKTTRVLIAAAAAAAVCAALATGARADDRTQMVVKYGDLDVSHVAGAAVLLHRLKVAATLVCGADGPRKFLPDSPVGICMEHALAEAVATVNAPVLTGMYRSQVAGSTQLASRR